MFLEYRINITHLIRQGSNDVEITFASAYNISEELRQKRGDRICWNGHYGRIYVRKAQYHFGWDWGPSFVTCGPWKPIFIHRYTARIDEVNVDVDLQDSLDEAVVTVRTVTEPHDPSFSTEVELADPEGRVLESKRSQGTSHGFKLARPELWYPHTHGKQPLYHVRVTVRSGQGETLDFKTQTFGVRRIELVQDPLEEGSSFYFTCNRIPIFMGGSNWIPGDSFLPRMTPDRYERWIDFAVRGNQNMLRVWGGGIYEDDAFFDAADRKGILIWQDFAFACGQYPADSQFIQSIKEEGTQALKRLRRHPSLAILAGNNEDYQVASEGLKHDMNMPEEEWAESSFPARVIYERILPDLVKEHSPRTIYWPGSPWGGLDCNTDRAVGDGHVWEVGSGMLLPYQRYPDIAHRFVSEFGMLSAASISTVKETFFGESEDRHPQSKEFEFHIKAHSLEKRMYTTIGENLRISFALETYVYLSQLVQSEAMYYAFRGWRRQFEGRQCGGALAWQTNDVWPAVSWSIVDYYERPKMAYYTIARALRPVATGVSRTLKFNPKPNALHEAYCSGRTRADADGISMHSTPHIYPPKETRFSVYCVNSRTQTQSLKIRVRFVSIKTGREVRESIEQEVEAKPTGTTEVIGGDGPEEEPTVIVSEIWDREGRLLSYDVDWPQPLKHLTFPDRGLKIEARGPDELVVSAAKPVKGLFLLNDGVEWSDNALDVVPGQEIVITAKGLKDEPSWIYYGMED